MTPLTEEPSGKLTVIKLGLPGQSIGVSKSKRAMVGLPLLVIWMFFYSLRRSSEGVPRWREAVMTLAIPW